MYPQSAYLNDCLKHKANYFKYLLPLHIINSKKPVFLQLLLLLQLIYTEQAIFGLPIIFCVHDQPLADLPGPCISACICRFAHLQEKCRWCEGTVRKCSRNNNNNLINLQNTADVCRCCKIWIKALCSSLQLSHAGRHAPRPLSQAGLPCYAQTDAGWILPEYVLLHIQQTWTGFLRVISNIMSYA